MRCGCPECGTYMIQSEGLDIGCVCPDCLFRCRMCMGTNTVVSRENLKHLVFTDHTAEHEAQEGGSALARAASSGRLYRLNPIRIHIKKTIWRKEQ